MVQWLGLLGAFTDGTWVHPKKRGGAPMDKMKGNNLYDIHNISTQTIEVSPSLSAISLNLNRLNFPIKKQILSEWIKQHDSTICYLQEIHFRSKDIDRLKVKGWKKIFNVSSKQRRTGVTMLIYRQNRV